MQTSGTFGALSDGVKKTMRGANPPAPAKASKPVPAPKATNHRRGGFEKHAKGGR